jgi:Peptidase A4 family
MFMGVFMRLLRYLLVCGSAALMAGALTLTAGTGVLTPAQASHVTHTPRLVSAVEASLARYLRHYRPQVILAGHAHAGPAATTAARSFNWSGYADGSSTTKAGTFTAVSGSWTAPSVTCSAEDQITTDWVGLDGMFSSTSLEQLGTMAWCYEGSPFYFTWWEMFPASSGPVEVGKTLQPGDKISASITRSGSKYTLKLTDATHPANSFTTKQTCAATTCADTSAEWISERPAFNQVGIAPLAHYNAFKLTNGAQTSSGKPGTIGSFPAVSEFTMIDATKTYNLNDVSSLTSKNSFSTTWQNSY